MRTRSAQAQWFRRAALESGAFGRQSGDAFPGRRLRRRATPWNNREELDVQRMVLLRTCEELDALGKSVTAQEASARAQRPHAYAPLSMLELHGTRLTPRHVFHLQPSKPSGTGNHQPAEFSAPSKERELADAGYAAGGWSELT
ncbi:hypothetical protein I5U67_10170 [Stenotrophomonas maltophilia]|uniref:Uncharacterized protein n=1 Tax=Stenotrophomonas maltophilia TaxID=40324 RepID=A0A6B8J5V2_STEMA|nr:hypothetical protein [Stenotrophomonas maltophilia]MBH1652535.1 hypothetical protein [Stenotrophomonas maltophilia]QGM02099.1 accessory factor UbiK family protein [Stenotrophomonas maltophilia]HDS1512124.1 hypothetical protein [Stenotrophomonas maltophilia]